MQKLEKIARGLMDERPRYEPNPPPPKPGSRRGMEELLAMRDAKIRSMEERLLDLKYAEEHNDLCYLEYSSWILTGNGFQRLLRERANPAFWGAAYMENYRLVQAVEDLRRQLQPEITGMLLRSKIGYQLFFLSKKSTKWEETHVGRLSFAKDAEQLLVFTQEKLEITPSYQKAYDKICAAKVPPYERKIVEKKQKKAKVPKETEE